MTINRTYFLTSFAGFLPLIECIRSYRCTRHSFPGSQAGPVRQSTPMHQTYFAWFTKHKTMSWTSVPVTWWLLATLLISCNLSDRIYITINWTYQDPFALQR